MKKLVQGIGENDMGKVVMNGKALPFYDAWSSMLGRCYSQIFQQKNPSYIGCSVDPKWHKLSEFKKWYDIHYIEGYQLDKDLKCPGNKVYGPDTCQYLPPALNVLLTCGKSKKKSGLPVGVYMNGNKYQVRCCIDKISTYISTHDTIEDASAAYVKAKEDEVRRVAAELCVRKEITKETYQDLLKWKAS